MPKMRKNLAIIDHDGMNKTDPISFKVRQILPRVPTELKHLHVVIKSCGRPLQQKGAYPRTMLHRSLLTPL